MVEIFFQQPLKVLEDQEFSLSAKLKMSMNEKCYFNEELTEIIQENKFS